ncbi:MAG: hypothetical protein ABSB24_02050 [Gaiellaceae bacterium]
MRGEPETVDELTSAILTEEEGEFGARWLLEFEDFDADCETNVYRATEEELRVGFTTRNVPPLEVVIALSARHPALWLGLRYHEPSNEIFGALQCRGGQVLGDGLSEPEDAP